jgi:hypothetical protein
MCLTPRVTGLLTVGSNITLSLFLRMWGHLKPWVRCETRQPIVMWAEEQFVRSRYQATTGQDKPKRTPSSDMWHSAALVRRDASEECIASIIRVKWICELGTTKAVSSNGSMFQMLVTATVDPSSLVLSTRKMEAMRSSETSVLSRITWRHILEDGVLVTDNVYFRSVIFSSSLCRRYFPPKRRLFQALHGITSQMMAYSPVLKPQISHKPRFLTCFS